MFLKGLDLVKEVSQNFGPVLILCFMMIVLGGLSVVNLGIAAIFVLMHMFSSSKLHRICSNI